MNRKKFIRRIQASGWAFYAEGAEHTLFIKKSVKFAVPRHNEVKPGIVRAWEKLSKELDGK